MTKYILKDKNFFDETCKAFSDFESLFQEACKTQMNDSYNFILITCTFPDTVFTFDLKIPKDYIEVKEDLKPYVWYDASEFDGNPNKYILMECTVNDEEEVMYITSYTYPNYTGITKKCTKFMYIKNLYQ